MSASTRHPSWPTIESPYEIEVHSDDQGSLGHPATAYVLYGDLALTVTKAEDGSGRFIVNFESATLQSVDVDVTVDGGSVRNSYATM